MLEWILKLFGYKDLNKHSEQVAECHCKNEGVAD